MRQTFGQYIRSLREKGGLTQKALSQAVGFRSLAHLSDIESGKRHPARETLPKFAEALGVSVQELESRDERGPIEALKNLFSSRPEMVAPFLRIVDSAWKLEPDELLDRMGLAGIAVPAPAAKKAAKAKAETVVVLPPEPVAPAPAPEEAKPATDEQVGADMRSHASAPKPADQPTLF